MRQIPAIMYPHSRPTLSQALVQHRIEDSLTFWKTALYLNLALLFVLMVGDSPRIVIGMHEVSVAVSAAGLYAWLRWGEITDLPRVAGFVIAYTLLYAIDSWLWYESMAVSFSGGYSKGFLLEGLRGSLPLLYLLFRFATVVCLFPLVLVLWRSKSIC